MATGKKLDDPLSAYEAPKNIQDICDEFDWLGIFRRTGEWRRGQPVYALTEFGRKFGYENRGEKEFAAAVEALTRRKLVR